MIQKLTSLILISFLFTACGGFQSQSSTNAPSDKPQDISTTTTNQSIKSVHYFRGGWFPMPGHANWSHDLNIEFLDSGLANINGKTEDELCGLRGQLSRIETSSLLKQIEELQISKRQGDSSVIDAGSEFIEITYKDLTKKKIHLSDLEMAIGDWIATNGSLLSSLIQATRVRLSEYCKSN